MSWPRRLLRPTHTPTDVKIGRSQSIRRAMQAMTAVKFDPSTVSKSVKENLGKNIEPLDDLVKENFREVYRVALRSISEGRDLHLLVTAQSEASRRGHEQKREGLSLDRPDFFLRWKCQAQRTGSCMGSQMMTSECQGSGTSVSPLEAGSTHALPSRSKHHRGCSILAASTAVDGNGRGGLHTA